MKTSTSYPQTLLLTVALCLPMSAWAQASSEAKGRPPVCDTRATVANLQKNASFTQVFLADADTCNSLRNILKRLSGSSVSGGKKLEASKALDPVAAGRERAAAKAETEFAAELAALQAQETDPVRRLVLEAALLDENGKYAARDLVLSEIQALIGR